MKKTQEPEATMDEPNDPIAVPAAIIQALAPVFEVSTTEMARLLGMSRHVVWRKIHRQMALPAEYQSRVMGAIRLKVLALDLYGYQTVNARREARRWMNDWLREPLRWFGCRRPIEFLGADEDQMKLLTLVEGIAAGVYM